MHCQNSLTWPGRMRCVFHFQMILSAKSMYRTRQGKMEPRTTFWSRPFLAANGVGNLNDEIRLTKRITDRPSAIRSWKIESISHRTAPIWSTLKGSQSVAHAQNTANVARVTVSVPATGVDDSLRAVEVTLAVEQA